MSRPHKPIDWHKVDQLLMAGCLGTEIAANFDMHHDTFYNRVEEKYGMGFTAYSSEKRCHGDSILRAKQFDNAIKGNTTMQVWLGKNRLGQRDHDVDAKSTAAIQQFIAMSKEPHVNDPTPEPEAKTEPTGSDPKD